MASRTQTDAAQPGDLLVVVHEFQARSPDELSLARGERIKLIERDDDFGDGWFLGENTESGSTGLFPEVYTRLAPKPTNGASLHQRAVSQSSAEPRPLQMDSPHLHPTSAPTTAGLPIADAMSTGSLSQDSPATDSHTVPLQIPNASATASNAPRSSFTTGPRSISMTLSGESPREEDISSPVMHETLSVIDEHITDMSTPRHSIVSKDIRANNDSGSEYSSHHRLSYINGQETEDEEQNLHSEAEVVSWSPAQVAEYLEDSGVEKKHCDIFQEQEINGEALLGMDQATIFLKEFELGPVGPRLRTWLKIKALQEEVKALKEAAKLAPVSSIFDRGDESPDTMRNRATSVGAMLPRNLSFREAPSAKMSLPRAASTAGHSYATQATSPLVQTTPSSPPANLTTRPSAASVRSLGHGRRHSSMDSTHHPAKPQAMSSASHKKTPSFDRNWSMGSPQKLPQSDMMRPTSSHMHSSSIDGNNKYATEYDELALSPTNISDLDRGYFSGNELENRKSRNVLRKRDSPNHSRNPSYSSEAGRRAAYNKRHSRIGSADSTLDAGSPVSSAARAYFGSSIKSKRSSSAFDFVRPLKPTNEPSPTVTKLDYAASPSIDAIASTPHVPGSETSSQGRASPSPAASHSFWSKKARSTGLRAISDAITGNERASATTGDSMASPIKESPLQSPARTGSSTPSGTSQTKSFDLESAETKKRLTGDSSANARRKSKSKKHTTSAYLRGREAITPQEAMVGCDYSGWMKKKSSSLMTTWKTRLFVLRGRRLSYFYSEFDTEEKGLIDISSHRVLPANNEKITGLHATLTRASSTPTSPQNATIPTAASAAPEAPGEDVSGMFIFKLVPPRAGLQKGVQFTKPIVHYFAVDSIQLGRLWMAALMKATIDRDDSLSVTTTYQQKTISLEKARLMRQRPPALMDEDEDEKASSAEKSKDSIQEDVIQEEDEEKGLAISGLDDAKALLEFAENGEPTLGKPPTPPEPLPASELPQMPDSPSAEHKRSASIKRANSAKQGYTPVIVSPIGGT